ncbi:MAG: GNAT family N-acetyltransferase [Spirochaetaceae bacterium]|jgi:ribosomal protein S18 acetylase RimI-like enzyme|nr:GNAT family N-acetyltransferase [Spirochaetaceae bacterium]
MNIRVMTMKDYPAACSLWRKAGGMGLRSLDDSEAGIGNFLKRNPQSCFIAELAGKTAGVILSGHDGRRGFIYHAAVEESRRGRGIGTALVRAVEEAMIREGIHKVALAAFRTNESGNRFWEARGFSVRHDLVYRDKSLNPENRDGI